MGLDGSGAWHTTTVAQNSQHNGTVVWNVRRLARAEIRTLQDGFATTMVLTMRVIGRYTANFSRLPRRLGPRLPACKSQIVQLHQPRIEDCRATSERAAVLPYAM